MRAGARRRARLRAHRRRLDEVLPWDRIDCGVTKPYLAKQLAAARNLAEVEDCVLAPCSVCGACDYEVVKNRTYDAKDYVLEPEPPSRRRRRPSARACACAKLGRLVALSHLETMHTLLRAIRRAGLAVAYSQGLPPGAVVSFGPAPWRIESRAEFIDLELVGSVEAADVATRLARELPVGLEVLDAQAVDS